MLHRVVILVIAVNAWQMAGAQSPPANVSFQTNDSGLFVNIGSQTVAEYVFRDEQILRPYFRHVRTLRGIQVTRNSPPQAADPADHDTMHPGLWLAFGDLNGADFWRNKAAVQHAGFIHGPQGGAGRGSFAVRNSYQAAAKTICTEDCLVTISVQSDGYLLDWVSAFRPAGGDITFGDQEEMGLGVRMATPLAVVNGGQITDSQGRVNGKRVWGQQADWCQYGGVLDGRLVGAVLMPDPQNFRPAWFHARDYGLLVANPFGRKAFTKGEPSRVVVGKDSTLRLRFGVLIYDLPAENASGAPRCIAAAYQEFVRSNPSKP